MPADWSIYIVYNRGFLAGKITIDSWVEEYKGGDQEEIIEKYLITDTFFKNKDHIVEKKDKKVVRQTFEPVQ